MNLAFSVDKLYETGWQPGDLAACERLPDGRPYPTLESIRQTFSSLSYDLVICYVQLFDCYRAVWSDKSGTAAGAVVGADEREAAVYALAQLRRAVGTQAAQAKTP